MSTVFASVVGAMVSALNAATPVSAQVLRSRVRTIPKEWANCVVVRPLQAELEQGVGQGVAGIWATSVQVECYVRSTAGTAPDLAVDVLLEAVNNRLALDRSLGGLVGSVNLLAINYDFDVDGESTACATLTFTVRHATAANSITQP